MNPITENDTCLNGSTHTRDGNLITDSAGNVAPYAPGLYTRILTIRSLGDSVLRLRKPLTLSVRNVDSEVVVELPQVELYAMADDVSDAVAELQDEVIDLYQEIRRRGSNELSPRALRWKLFLDQYVTSNDADWNSRFLGE